MIKLISGIFFFISLLLGITVTEISSTTSTDSKTVIEVLEQKGEDYSDKRANTSLKGVSAEAGEQLFHQGFAQKMNGRKTSKQSKHFVCSSCHNIEREDPDLTKSDPEARLVYTSEKGLPFLQGTTMFGVVNRETYYNGDYEKKYGDLVNDARNNIRNAIQLCATECAQGRKLKDWELESILAYLWTLQLEAADLPLNNIENASVGEIKAQYLSGSPATFIPPPSDRKNGSGLQGKPENGKLIYNQSCLHCHYQKRYAFLHLDSTKLSFNHLCGQIKTHKRHSIYQVTRWGVPVKSGKSNYMPQYTAERMSNQQLADLRAYIEQEAI